MKNENVQRELMAGRENSGRGFSGDMRLGGRCSRGEDFARLVVISGAAADRGVIIFYSIFIR